MTLETEISDKELENARGGKMKRLSCPVSLSTTSSTVLEVIGMWGTATICRRLGDLDRKTAWNATSEEKHTFPK